jgi:hypothetical protein
MRYPATRIAVALLALLLNGCASMATVGEIAQALSGPAPPVEDARPYVGTYDLQRFADTTLPYHSELSGGHACPGGGVAVGQEIAAGTLVISPGGQVELDTHAVVTCRLSSGETRTDTLPQRVTAMLRQGNGDPMIHLGGGESLRLVWDEGKRVVQASQLGAQWVRGEASASRPQAERPQPSRVANHLPPACRDHQDLQNLPETPTADTAGLGARVASAFPGWKVATEAEIGCVAIQDQWSPTGFWSREFGKGKTWWVQHGDVTGDGIDDVLVYISREDGEGWPQAVLLLDQGGGIVASGLRGPLQVDLAGGGQRGGCRYDPETGRLDTVTADFPRATVVVGNNMNWIYELAYQDGEMVPLEDLIPIGACH